MTRVLKASVAFLAAGVLVTGLVTVVRANGDGPLTKAVRAGDLQAVRTLVRNARKEAKEGAHAGDMPNLHIPANGDLVIEIGGRRHCADGHRKRKARDVESGAAG